MSPLPKWLVSCLHGFFVACTIAVVLVTFFVSFPMLEGRYFPVVETLEITKIEDTGDGRAVIYGSFNKVRQCDYVGISWSHRQANGVLDRVSVELLRRPGDTSSPNRPLGQQIAGPWIIGITAEMVRATSVVELTHRCHPFWTTVTQFYP